MNDLTNEQKQMCKKISDKYGIKQLTVAIEEMSELTQSLCKLIRILGNGQPTLKNYKQITADITEETADVLIMIEQVGSLLNLSNADIQKMIDYKLERTLKGE